MVELMKPIESGINLGDIQLHVLGTPVIDSINPSTAAPGDTIVVSGKNFGVQQGTGYVLFSDAGTNWGQPGDLATFQVLSWTDSQIAFLVPTTDANGYQTTPGTVATVTVTNSAGLSSSSETLEIQPAVPPAIDSVNPSTAGPGDMIVMNGQNFGSPRGSGYVQFSDNGVNWGQPGDVATFHLVSWNDTQITFLVPTKDANGYQITPGTTATINVTNKAGLTSGQQTLALHSAVRWPVSINSGVTSIGTTGNGFVQTNVNIDQSGNLTANTQVWDTSGWGIFTGFHAGCAVRLFDTFGNVIATFPAGPFGVQGGQNNSNPWSATLTPEECAQIYSISVVNFYDADPNSGINGVTTWIENNAAPLASAAAAIVAAV